MRILIHAIRLAEGKKRHLGGNFHHVYHFLNELSKQDIQDEIFIVTDHDAYAYLIKFISPSRIFLFKTRMPYPFSLLLEDLFIQKYIRKYKIQVYHRLTGQLPCLRINAREVTTIPDLNFTEIIMSPARRLYKWVSYYWTVKKADHIICVSNFTKLQLVKHFKINPVRIQVIHHGTNPLPIKKIEESKKNNGYWMTFGHQVHKNVETAISAMNAYNHRFKLSDQLYIIGESEHLDIMKDRMKKEDIKNIKFMGKISDEKLGSLYRLSKGMIFLSLYEGFGLPVLEAMSCGCPVIASNRTSLPEVCGDAAVMVDPFDIQSIVIAMHQLRKNRKFRSALINKGQMRCRDFTWQKSIELTLNAYHSLGTA